MLAVLGCASSAGLAAEVSRVNEGAALRAVEAEAEGVAHRLGREIEGRLQLLTAMADRWSADNGTPRSAWERDAANQVRAFAGLRALQRLDTTGRISWIVPAEPYANWVGFDMRAEPVRLATMDAAWRRAGPVSSPPVNLFAGGEGVLLFVPMYTETRFDGWLAGVLELPGLIASAIGPQPGYHLRLLYAGELKISSGGPPAPLCATRRVPSLPDRWQVTACATPELLGRLVGPLPLLTLLLGLAITTLLTALLRAARIAEQREAHAQTLAVSLRDKAEALDRARRELAELSWSVSHELQAPLRAIDGHAALLAEDVPQGARPALARIRGNAARMSAQLDGLLKLLRVARAEVTMSEVDVTNLASRHLARLAAHAPGRRVVVDVEPGIRVRGDSALLELIVRELLENAWKFTSGRAPGHIWVTSAHPGGFIVRDDGAGFDMAFAHKLFATFERLHAPGEFDGLGVGLALAERAVARMGGRIEAEGRPGGGAAFKVCLE